MSITRKFLKGMGLTEEQVDSIIDAHTETVDGLKEQIKALKEDADALPGVRKELKDARDELANQKKDSWKVKYDAVKEDFDNYRKEQESKETHKAKENAYNALLKEIGISEKRIASVLKVSDVDGIELDGDGNVKDADTLKKSLTDEWADFITTTEKKGVNTPNPPVNTGGDAVTKEDILKIKDRDERIHAIAEHKELFAKNKGV